MANALDCVGFGKGPFKMGIRVVSGEIILFAYVLWKFFNFRAYVQNSV